MDEPTNRIFAVTPGSILWSRPPGIETWTQYTYVQSVFSYFENEDRRLVSYTVWLLLNVETGLVCPINPCVDDISLYVPPDLNPDEVG